MPSQRRRVTILCIGDDPIQLNLRCSFLRERGFEVLSSTNGYEGLILFGQQPVEAVILDLDDGDAESSLVAGELKRTRPEIPVIMLVAERPALGQNGSQCASAVLPRTEMPEGVLRTLRDILKGPVPNARGKVRAGKGSRPST
jgi:CheY-like chemotaxis protein